MSLDEIQLPCNQLHIIINSINLVLNFELDDFSTFTKKALDVDIV